MIKGFTVMKHWGGAGARLGEVRVAETGSSSEAEASLVVYGDGN